MRKHALVLLFSCAIGFSSVLQAAPAVVKNLRLWRAPDHTRVVFDVSKKVEHRVIILGNPDRLVVDLSNAIAVGALATKNYEGPFLKGIRIGKPKPNILRIVLDLKKKVNPRSFVLRPNEIYGHRLVFDLYDKKQVSKPIPAPSPAPTKKPYAIVAIDAGHGGEDPGAIGRRGTREKNVTFKVALELKKLVDKDTLLRSSMVRRGDYYISLRKRTAIARREQADLFVSIHADAYPKSKSVSGSSVYALSQRGASSEGARWLADKENAADLIGGVSLRDKDDLLAKVLWDLSMTKTVSESLSLGRFVLDELGRVGRLHRKHVEQAGFAVLKSPDMPSILVETAFLSNPSEEKLLRNRNHQRKIATAIYKGIKRYLKQKPMQFTPSGPIVHIVRSGDSLSEIAVRYRVSMGSIKKANNMKTDTVRIGQKLKIPAS
ncbi:MAG: N-acetylmuramoyl-L-alanine amidase [Arenicellales bacterium]|nr:N-acetylmuramoyl-L-alanine amidase [Arenicellales bacterium]